MTVSNDGTYLYTPAFQLISSVSAEINFLFLTVLLSFWLQNRREIWNTGISPSSGPRALLLKRSENGFGFTLRHFIVYPPESNAVITFVYNI